MPRPLTAALLLLAGPLGLAACSDGGPKVVMLSGTVTEGAAEGPGDTALAGIELVAWDLYDEVVCADRKAGTGCSATTDASGTFTLAAPGGEAFFVALSGPDHVTTSFTGLAPITDFQAQDGALWVRTPAQLAALRDEFRATCPQADAVGGVLEGQVRLWLNGIPTDELPIVTTATVIATPTGQSPFGACYLPDEGEEEEPGDTGLTDTGTTDTGGGDTGSDDGDPDNTGSTGRFAIFGLPDGPTTVYYSYVAGDTTFDETKLYRVPSEGVVPVWPALVPMPY